MLQFCTAILVSAAIFFVALRRPQTGVLTLLALVPFNGLLAVAPVTAAYWKEMCVLSILAASVVVSPPHRPWASQLQWTAPLVLLVPFGVISALVTHGAAAFFPIKIAFFYLLLLLVIWRFPFTARDKDRLITILMVTATISALFGLAQQLLQGDRLVEMGYNWGEQIRTTGPLLRSFGTFNQPFPFGLYLMVALLTGLSAALIEPGRLRSRLFWPAAAVIFPALVFSVVRASYVGLLVGLVVLGVTQDSRITRALRYVLGVVVLGLISFLVFPSGSSSAAALFSSSSLQQRISHWTESFRSVLFHPLGTGLGNTGSSAVRSGPGFNPLEPPYQPDNQYLKILIELGVLGMALYTVVGILMVWSLLQLIRCLPAGKLDHAFACAALAVTAAACVAGVFATYLEIFPLDLLFWTIPAVACCVPARPSQTSGSATTGHNS